MQYTYKDANLSLNGDTFLCESVSFSLSNSLEAIYEYDDTITSEHSPKSEIEGSLSIEYLLTGRDPLKPYRDNPSGLLTISGNFGGLFFQSGYLKSYSARFDKFSPIKVSSNIVFFDDLEGSFSSAQTQIPTFDVLHVNDVTLDGNTIGPLDQIESIDYKFDQEIIPKTFLGQSIPEKIILGRKTVSTSVSSTFLKGTLPIQGDLARLEISLSHPNQPNLDESFYCYGKVSSRSISSSFNSFIKASFSIIQNIVTQSPTITSVSGTVLSGSVITINGTNLQNANKILFCINGETTPRGEAEILSRTSTTIKVVVPQAASSGLIIAV